MNYTFKKNETLLFVGNGKQIVLSYRGIKWNSGYFHLLHQNDNGKVYPLYVPVNDKLILGRGTNAIELTLLGFNQDSCSFYADLPSHIVLTQGNKMIDKIALLNPTKIADYHAAIESQLILLVQQQKEEASQNTDRLLEILTVLRQTTDDIELDLRQMLKRERRLQQLIDKI